MVADPAPFIVTLMLDSASQARFDALRAAHFPAGRLFVGAHVTLFHALPIDLDVGGAVQAEAARHAPWPVQVTGVRLLGRGVAYTLASAALRDMRDRLRQRWAARLTPQDLASWQPHVTIQNKVQPVVARTLCDGLSAGFTPYEVTAAGLALWIYRNGPWEAAGTFAFAG